MRFVSFSNQYYTFTRLTVQKTMFSWMASKDKMNPCMQHIRGDKTMYTFTDKIEIDTMHQFTIPVSVLI